MCASITNFKSSFLHIFWTRILSDLIKLLIDVSCSLSKQCIVSVDSLWCGIRLFSLLHLLTHHSPVYMQYEFYLDSIQTASWSTHTTNDNYGSPIRFLSHNYSDDSKHVPGPLSGMRAKENVGQSKWDRDWCCVCSFDFQSFSLAFASRWWATSKGNSEKTKQKWLWTVNMPITHWKKLQISKVSGRKSL